MIRNYRSEFLCKDFLGIISKRINYMVSFRVRHDMHKFEINDVQFE